RPGCHSTSTSINPSPRDVLVSVWPETNVTPGGATFFAETASTTGVVIGMGDITVTSHGSIPNANQFTLKKETPRKSRASVIICSVSSSWADKLSLTFRISSLEPVFNRDRIRYSCNGG